MFRKGFNMTLKEWLRRALEEKWAIPHFNISTLEQLKAMVNVAKRVGSPLHIGTSGGEAKYLGMRQAVYLVRAYREEAGLPIFLNADHFHSIEDAKMAIDAGYDSINIDLSELPYEENIKGTKEVVEYAKFKDADISAEGELGHLLGSSELQEKVIDVKPEDMTDPDQAIQFLAQTGIDRLAPAVGNLHGIAANAKSLDFERIAALRDILPKEVSLVLHGGSGIDNEQVKKAIGLGMNNVHINTEIRVAYAESLRKTLADNPNETTPYKIFPPVFAAMEKVIEEKIKLFGANNRI